MSTDSGLMTKLTAAIVDILAAVTIDAAYLSQSGKAFKTVALWRHQVAATAAGAEAFDRYAPFAFVKWDRCSSKRGGDGDLVQTPEILVLVGQTSITDGGAWLGETEGALVRPGVSELRDLVIAAMDKTYPAADGVESDDIYYETDDTAVDTPKAHAIEMRFTVNNIRVQSV